MGKSSKLFKTLLAGVKAFKSPSKEKSSNVKSSTYGSKRDELDRSQFQNGQQGVSPFMTATGVEGKLAARASGDEVVKGKGYSRGCPRKNWNILVDESQREEWAAAKIQAAFRCYLAQRAFRALKALVRLQSLARGRLVRKQAASTLRCIHALVRVQAHVRGSRVRTSELGQLVQRHLQQTKQQRRKSAEGWISSTSTLQELQAKAQSKQEAVMKRQRALVYAFSEQLRKSAPKQGSLVNDCELDRNHWAWIWLERWMAVRPWENSPKATKEQLSTTLQTKKEKPKLKPESDKCKGTSRKENIVGRGLLTDANKSPSPLAIQEEPSPRPATLPSLSSEVRECASKPMTESVNLPTGATKLMAAPVPTPSSTGMSLPKPPLTQSSVVTSPDKSATLCTLTAPLDSMSSSNPGLSAIPRVSPYSSQPSKFSSTVTSEEQQILVLPSLSIPVREMANSVTSEENASGMNGESATIMNGAVPLMNGEEYLVDGETCLVDDANGTVEPEVGSQPTGMCNTFVKPVSPKGSEVSSKRNAAAKQEHGECSSPSVPNYMATMQSSKAKVRPYSSPKQKIDPLSPSTKKRQSFSGSEGKNMPATQRQISLVRGGSKGTSAPVKNGSETTPLANGESWRYGK